MIRPDPLNLRWYVVVNDLLGGFAISHVDKPLSQHNFKEGEDALADFLTEEMARHIADLHNEWLSKR